MARRDAASVEAYLAELPGDRREVIARVRELVLRHLPAGYEEDMNWGMIAYQVPLERHPGTGNGQPLMYAALAAQKNHCSLYLMTMDAERQEALRRACEQAGRKLDAGKSCVRFRRSEDVPWDAIADLVAATPVEAFIALQ